MKIGVIGLGKIGFPLLAVLNKHFDTIGIDLKENPKIPDEPGIRKIIQESKYNSILTSTNFNSLEDCDVVFCIVNTPSMKSGEFTNKYLIKAIRSAKPYLKKCKLFVINSTVMPGSCDKLKKIIGKPFCYSPLFIAVGKVINDLQRPDFYLVGESSKKAGDLLEYIYYKICLNSAPTIRMKPVEAEITKITVNAYITMKITFANVIGMIAKKYKADDNKILFAAGLDNRIGNKYFKAGGAYGGPCFPRDNVAFSKMAKKIPNYALLTDKINQHVARKVGYFDKRPEYQNILKKDRWRSWT